MTFQISKSAEFEVFREKTAELKRLNEQLQGEVDDLNVKYSDMQASVDKETRDSRSSMTEVTQREEKISKITEKIKEEELRKVKS